ncbi:AsmA family protein [Dongia deserti]|uniref:AsmA family protein n=1 Tax=Dongia deserti TaxID=2268030 RepID=UPI000E64FCCA|nr:AsmA family protein [Dongia deserti]
MRLKIILTGIGLALVALVALAFTVVMATDFNDYRDLVQQRVKAATGRDLVIAGNIDASFSLSPRLSAKQVSFRNAPWSDIPQMASLDEIEAEIAVLPLLTGLIRIKEVVLRGGQVVVETNKEGVGNWVLNLGPQTNPESASTNASGLPKIDRMTIEDVTLLYRDGETGGKQTLAVKRFAAEDAPGAGIRIAMKGAWNDRPLELAGTIGAPRQFTEGPLPLNLDGKLSDVALTLRGEVGDPTTFSNLSLEVESAGPSLAALGDIFGIELPNSAPYTLETRVSGDAGKFTFSDAKAKVGGSDAAGNIVLDTSLDVTELTATLASQRLDFKDLGLDEGGGTATSNSDGRLFSAEPWPLDWLKDINGDVTWPVGTLVRGGASASDVALALGVKDGTATLKYVKAHIEGGTINGNGTLKPGKGSPILAIKLGANGIQSAPLLSMMGLEDVLTVGRVNMNMDVNGPATSLRSLMAGLNGKASFVTGEGEVRNSFARLLLANLFGLLTPSGDNGSRISCIAGNFDIKQGIASTRGTVVDTPGATVVGAGNIDLRSERIDMRVDPKSKNLNLSAIAVPMRVTGPLASPNVLPDPVATVGNTVNFATGTVNVVTLGIFGAITGLGKGENLGENPCATALNNALTGKSKQSTGEKVLQGVGGAAQGIGEGAADVLKGVGEGIGNLFGQ